MPIPFGAIWFAIEMGVLHILVFGCGTIIFMRRQQAQNKPRVFWFPNVVTHILCLLFATWGFASGVALLCGVAFGAARVEQIGFSPIIVASAVLVFVTSHLGVKKGIWKNA